MCSSNSTSDLTDEKLKDQQRSTPASRRCPSCDHELDCNPDMVGFPAGVKFDPSDQELIEHLESMVKEGGSRAHPLIGDFIHTIDQGNDGICYTHPENLPGVTRNGVSKHFFHRPSKAYTSGTRKRRKIKSERGLRSCDDVGEACWHKTGKTRPVLVGGQQKGWKKTLVLYNSYGKQRKPEKTNWVMHQYHLGREEKDGELVVSKVFYQQKQLRPTATMMGQNDERVEVTSEAMKDMLPGCGAAAAEAGDAMIQLQQHLQQRQADGQSRFTSARMSREVGVGNPLVGDQGLLHETHHIPSQHNEVRSMLVKPVHTMPSVESTPLEHRIDQIIACSAISLSPPEQRSENQEDRQQQKKVDCRRPCSSEEAMIACQTSSTEEDVQEELQLFPRR
ncbi:NAC domain-containing protein 10 [Sorghum bicolor]|uniref:NAC domain-containing protein n=2 Tax=Sorghum bicolor TaxID=4558 RepID=A0A1B6P706_SORBI|nr:NAC domain-containing protein 10 [Sorghum bicolor]KXG21499.1 hypothetical protein SORBI_3009G071600 [Sorghum bicolor]OQU77584.1 hypothetical protein SORBI_3009G071600 [Sorghum bicolor]|eukprot:XP_021303920.1 NAC domain-containing protein 10 [Sorghum bicolor]